MGTHLIWCGRGAESVQRLLLERLETMLLLGAHCDDIAIGAGATLLQLCRTSPGVRVTALVLTGGGSLREHEERGALAAFCPGAELDVVVLNLPDGHLPSCRERVEESLADLRGRVEPDLLFAPAPHDDHQDHRLLAQLAQSALGRHFVLGYEIVKWDSDLAQPQVYMPAAEPVLTEKIDTLFEHYGSQRDRRWFRPEVFTALASVRGVQCHARYAEAFHLSKVVLGTGPGRVRAHTGQRSGEGNPTCACS